MTRSIPDKVGRTICVRFAYAWGAWKAAWAALATCFISLYLYVPSANHPDPPLAFILSMLLFLSGFIASAFWTGLGLVAAYRAEMKVWVGEGMNQARMLLPGLLAFGAGCGLFIPVMSWVMINFFVKRNIDRKMISVTILGVTRQWSFVLGMYVDSGAMRQAE
jgi:hypothetical protein